jgi:Ca2+-binding RTX toxin-like protein
VAVEDSGRAVVAGGPGPDSIQVGNGANTVHGDSALSFETGSRTVTPLTGDPVSLADAVRVGTVSLDTVPPVVGDEAGDSVTAGLGGSLLYGGGGGDRLSTANDSPLADVPANAASQALYRSRPNTIVGGAGSDVIRSGSASDTVYTGDEAPIDADDLGSGDADTDVNTVDTGSGNDVVHGSNGQDNVTTGSTPEQGATVFGGGAADVLVGGAGTDALWGGPGDDYVIAEASTVDTTSTVQDQLGTAFRVTRLPLAAPPSTKTLGGGGGSDRLYGGDGRALLYGDGVAGCEPTPGAPLSDPPAQVVKTDGTEQENDAADLVLGGEGVDVVNAGGGDDHVLTRGGDDAVCGSADGDRLSAGSGIDHVWAGTGDDTAYGETGRDHVFGNDGVDVLYGGTGRDDLEGGPGADTVLGGTEEDLVVGGTRAPGRADAGDVLYGDAQDDVLIGDNGTREELFDLASGDASLGGRDTVHGGSDADRGHGGLDVDTLHGGDGPDVLEGNPGADLVFGEDGRDDLVGGTGQLEGGTTTYPDAGDLVDGGRDDDVVAGDNAVLRTVTTGGTPISTGRGIAERTVLLHDLGPAADPAKAGRDVITGGDATDVLLGQGDVDEVDGGAGDDYAEGGQAGDVVRGGTGSDDLVGGGHVVRTGTGAGRTGQPDGDDDLFGGPGADVALGDNGQLLRGTPATSDVTKGRGAVERLVELYDLGDAPLAGTSGRDVLLGAGETDVLLGQAGRDRALGGTGDDHLEGGPDEDWLEGGAGDDDQVGGSSTVLGDDTGVRATGQPDGADVVLGGAGDDLQLGDNAVVSRTEPVHPLTVRLSAPGLRADGRSLRLLDLSQGAPLQELAVPAALRFGADHLSGGSGVDVQLGQDGDERVWGGSEDDYQEGNGGRDVLHGDAVLPDAASLDVGWRGTRSGDQELEGVQGPAGQDDQLGGSSRRLHRDDRDVLRGDGAQDFQLGDNGQLLRTVLAGDVYATYVDYSPTMVRRQADRYDVGFGAALPGPFGGDDLLGGDGDDAQWGQDGDDLLQGEAGNDDMHGELGDDTMLGGEGEDAMVGDRGVITNTLVKGGRQVREDTKGPAFLTYQGLREGQLDRRVDIGRDGDGDVNGTGSDVEQPGLTHGGRDTMRGGPGHDSMHGAFGDDLMNGDSGGDWLFGAEGVDVMWGGQGKPVSPLAPDANERTDPSSPYFDSWVDYLFGGASGAENADNRYGVTAGADVLDWRPRGSFAACAAVTRVSASCDPGDWFRITGLDDDDVANNQHHSGIDWIYGGEGRDVLQGDVGKNGPDAGDRLLDWNGAYNLYSRCNASYGDDGDVRQHSPAVERFLHTLAFGSGAGTSQQDLRTAGTSGERELAFVSPGEKGNSGSAFPGTPGHFTTAACAP